MCKIENREEPEDEASSMLSLSCDHTHVSCGRQMWIKQLELEHPQFEAMLEDRLSDASTLLGPHGMLSVCLHTAHIKVAVSSVYVNNRGGQT